MGWIMGTRLKPISMLQIARRNLNNHRYADDIALMAESEEL